MRIGLDFDNTIVCYDGVFHRCAIERGLIPSTVGTGKDAVRDHLRAAGRESQWTELQGHVYGPGMAAAKPYPGVLDFIAAARAGGADIWIVSHRTRHPFLGPPHDLHACAGDWLERHGLCDPVRGVSPGQIRFELTKGDKLARIAAVGCKVFVDDLPELLTEAAFPAGVERILFDPDSRHGDFASGRRVSSWDALTSGLVPAGLVST